MSALAIRRNFKLPPLKLDINCPLISNAPIPPPTPDKRSFNYLADVNLFSYHQISIEEENWKDLLCSAK